MKPLVGNELVVLKLLEKKPKGFGELLKETKLTRSVVSKHLKSLQKRGRVIRNADRKYTSLKPQIKDSDIPTSLTSLREECVGFFAESDLFDDALSLTTNKQIQILLKVCYVKGTFNAILCKIAKIVNDALEIKDLFQIQIITRRFLDEYLMPSLQRLAMETRGLMETWTESLKERPDDMKELLKDPEFASFLKRPFDEAESQFLEVAESAFRNLIEFDRKLRKARDKKPGVELTLEELEDL